MAKEKEFKERSPESARIRQELLGKALVHLKGELTGKKRILDAGCGDGILYTMIAKQLGDEMQLDGMDISEPMLNVSRRKARENNLNINYFLGSVTEIPCEDNTYDIVFCTMMFHHLNMEIKLGALKEFHRVLKKGGKLIYVDIHPPKGFLKRLLYVPTSVNLFALHKGTTYKIGKIEKMLKERSFTIAFENYIEPDRVLIVAQK